jgi:hypothetical protein
MANFCNKCGAPVSGIFCVKCGADTRLAPSPAPHPAAPVSAAPPAAVASPTPPGARFCNKCGAPSSGTMFCNKCGADMRQAAAPASPAAVRAAQTPPLAAVPSQSAPSPQTPAKGSPLVKILVAFVVFVVVIGALAAGGVYYVVYRVKQKVHEVAREVPGLGSSSDSGSSSGDNSVMGSISKMVSGNSGGSSDSGSNGGISGDPCRLLSKEEVGRAIGVGIVATETSDAGCSYLAQGDSADMTSKHMAAMMGAKGADAKTQQTIQTLTGGMAKMIQSEGHDTGMDHNGNVPVFLFSVDNHSADTQMQLNRKVLGGLGPGAQDIPGIGDQAFDEAGAMMMVRKGDKLIRIMYSTCPCSVEAIKPLAKKLADRL